MSGVESKCFYFCERSSVTDGAKRLIRVKEIPKTDEFNKKIHSESPRDSVSLNTNADTNNNRQWTEKSTQIMNRILTGVIKLNSNHSNKQVGRGNEQNKQCWGN